MGLKLALEIAPAPAGPGRPWGDLAEKGQTAYAVRFETRDASVSVPVHCFRRWELKAGRAETLTIFVDEESITLEGRNLAAVRDALDDATLRIVRLHHGPHGSAAGATIVTAITFAPIQPTDPTA